MSGWVKAATGSYSLALMPLAVLTLISVTTLLLLTRKGDETQLTGKAEVA